MRQTWLAFLIALCGATADPWLSQKPLAGEPEIDSSRVDIKSKQVQLQENQNPPGKRIFLSQADAAMAALDILKSGFFQLKPSVPAVPPGDPSGTLPADVMATMNARAKNLGFESVSEIADAKLGLPLPVRRIGLKQLANFNGTTDNPKQLLTDTQIVFYAITVKEVARSSLTLLRSGNEKDGTWRWIQRGAPHFTSQIAQFRKADTRFILFIPGLHLHFLASGNGDDFMLTPISSIKSDGLELIAGQTRQASKVLSELTPVASKMLIRHDRKKPNRDDRAK